mgnify:CR=1 FL=1
MMEVFQILHPNPDQSNSPSIELKSSPCIFREGWLEYCFLLNNQVRCLTFS